MRKISGLHGALVLALGVVSGGGGGGTGDIPNFDAGMSHIRKFNTAGTYGFHCTIHQGMTATLTVQ